MRLRWANLGVAVLALVASAGPPAALAQQVKKPAAEAAPKKDPNAALKAFDAGTKAYDAGKLDPAIQSLTTALSSGGLAPPKMAKAYYYRGLAYRKQKKPAQALSDLTTAVWVNGGLSDSDKAAAMQARNDVYREAGLGDQAPPIANAVVPGKPAAGAPPAAAPAAAAPTPPPAPAVAAAAPPPAATPPTAPSNERPVWQADANSAPPASTQSAESAWKTKSSSAPRSNGRVEALQQTAAASNGSDAYVPPPPAPPASGLANTPEPAPTSNTLAPIAKAGESISGFFSNMFGQSSSPPPAQATTGSTGVEGSDGWDAVSGGGRPSGPSVQVSASEPQWAPGFETTASPAATTRTARAPKTSSSGKYRLQLASVRSREEADRLVEQLKTSHASEIGSAEAMVDEAVIGNMGTFYRVQLGPYANAAEPKKVCSSLRPQGFDCQVITQ